MGRRRARALDSSVPLGHGPLGEEAAALLARWRPLLPPFLTCLARCEQQEHAARYIVGLLSPLAQKTTETIAYYFHQPRHGLQHFLGASAWDWSGFLAELTRQTGVALAEPDGVITLSLLGFPKKGDASVGVERQCPGPAHTRENCQVAIYLGYASRKGTAVVDVRLYLPPSWARDRARRRRCGVPPRLSYLSHGQLAVEMLDRLGGGLPHAWVVADGSLGRLVELRQALGRLGKRYLVAVPPATLVRPLEGAGRPAFFPAERLGASLEASAWSPSQSGHRRPELAAIPVVTQVSRRAQQRETLVVVRRSAPHGPAIEFYLSNASVDLPADEWARAANAVPRTVDYLQHAMDDAGLASYEVRTWVGWYHHQALALVASWLLQSEAAGQARRGERS